MDGKQNQNADSSIPNHELVDWIVRYFDDQLDDYEFAALTAALEGDDHALELFQSMSLQALTVAELSAVHPQKKPRPRRYFKWWGVGIALAASIVFALVVALRPGETPAVAKIVEREGMVTVMDAAGETAPLTAGDRILPGQRVVTAMVGSLAKLEFPDGTTVKLFDSTEVSCREEGFKQIDVSYGNVIADVQPQPSGKPLRIVTDQAVTEVLGTVLAVHATSNKTDVDVLEGKVRVARAGDQETVDVAAGQKATVSRRHPLASRPHTDPPDRWKVDFERNLPREWLKGIWVKEDLPAGSKGGVRAEARPGFWDPSITWYEIESYNRWSQGLFTIQDDSKMRIKFHTDRREWIQVILLTRDKQFQGIDKTYEFVSQIPKGEEGQQWHTMEVPLSEFKRTIQDPKIGYVQSPINPPVAGQIVYKVIISTQDHNLGLVIDEISFGPDRQ